MQRRYPNAVAPVRWIARPPRNQRVWADIDCNDPVGTGTKVFKAGEEKYYKTQWSRLYSDPQTCTGRAEVAPGGYYLHTVIGDNASAPFTFNLGG